MKRLVPLGFTRSDIRKELYLSQGGPEGANLMLQGGGGGGGGSLSSSLGGVAVDGEGQGVEKEEGERGEEEEDGGKVFTIQCMQVSQCSVIWDQSECSD